MAGEAVEFKRVSQIYREESRRKTLTRLEPDFYGQLAGYIEDLQKRSAKATKADFNSPKAVLLRDELRKVERKRDQIYAIRERKVAMLALAKVGGGPVDVSVLTTEEKALFEGLVDIFQRGREASGGAAPTAPAEALEEPEPEPQEEAPAETKEKAVELLTVRILEDVPPFAGLEGTYTLRKSDVVSLPKNVADVLVAKGAAAEVKGPG